MYIDKVQVISPGEVDVMLIGVTEPVCPAMIEAAAIVEAEWIRLQRPSTPVRNATCENPARAMAATSARHGVPRTSAPPAPDSRPPTGHPMAGIHGGGAGAFTSDADVMHRLPTISAVATKGGIGKEHAW